MKKSTIALLVLTASVLRLPAAIPLSWTVETSRAQPATFEAYQGETLTFEAALQAKGKPLEAPLNYSFFWQTNGMGNLYWEAPCTVPSASSPTGAGTNVLFATWLPDYDVGAKVYNCFIGSPSNIYHAAFQLRLRPSPGATPNALPLPTPVIDFAKVRVLNPPWPGGGGGGVDTNAVRDIIRDQLATNGIRAVDGAARPLPKYLHALDFDDSYPDDAAWYYAQRGSGVPAASCSSVRSGGVLYRNFDFPFDDRAEFVVRVSSRGGDIPVAAKRFASVGVAQVGTNLTEQIVTSGKWSKWYKALPGATVDGINENGVVAEINVVDTPVTGWYTTGNLHPLAAVRWVLDNATNAQSAAEYIAANIRFPQGWTQNFHYMIADAESTYIVENGTATDGDEYHEPDEPVTMTNFQLSKFPWDGMGMERFGLLLGGANITNAWYTRAYHRETNPPWVSDLRDVLAYTNDIYNAWASHPKEYFRGKTTNGQPWWQTVHTSVYDISNRVLRVAVQETDDWYTFQVPSSGAKVDAYTRAETDEKLAGKRGIGDLRVYEFSTNSVIAPECLPIVSDGRTIHSYSFMDARQFGINRLMLIDGDGLPLGVDFDISSGVVSVSESDEITFGGRPVTIGSWPYLVGPQPIAGDSVAKASETDEKLADVYDELHTKANRPDPLPSSSGNLASLTEDGDLEDSGIASSRIESVEQLAGLAYQTASMAEGSAHNANEAITIIYGTELPKKADRAMISATDPTFSNAVKTVMQIEDRAQNLSYTITADDKRFYFTPTGAINPED